MRGPIIDGSEHYDGAAWPEKRPLAQANPARAVPAMSMSARIRELARKEGALGILSGYSRGRDGTIFVQGGGCSGFQYGFSFDEDKQDDDFLITKNSENKEINFF